MRFLACTDGSPYAEKAVKACALAAKYAGYGIVLLNVIEDVVKYDELPSDPGFLIRKEKAEVVLSRAEKVVKEISDAIKCDFRLAHGPVASEIVRIAVSEGVESIFLGTKGTSRIKRILLGNVADDVLRHAHCPVTVVR